MEEVLAVFRILVVEDDESTRLLLEHTLYDGGFEPLLAADSNQALEILDRKYVDLILLDLILPGVDGFSLLEQLRRADTETPIMVLSARQSLSDKRRCFSMGADSYLTKPMDGEELLLRIGAVLRRARIAAEHRLVIGRTVLSYDTLTVSRDDIDQELPLKEFLILFKLLSYPGKIFTRHQLMDEIWDLDTESDDHTISVHVNRLRNRFRDNPDFRIVTVRNLGYKAVRT